MHITLRQLEVFTEVLKSGSTTQASVVLALSQSAVSAALADLEGQLGVQLFDRVGKRLVVNEHGRLLYPKALSLLEQSAEIEQLFRRDNGALRIYASSTIGNYLLPAMIARYRQDFPEIPLELHVGNTQDVITSVSEFRVDLGLIEGPCHHPDLVTQPWLEDELVVFCAPTHPLARQTLSLSALAEVPWILREQGSGTREVLDHLLLAHLPRFRLVMELGNSEAIKHAVRHCIGISCLSRHVIAEQLESGVLMELSIPLPKFMRTLYLVHHRQKHLSNVLQRFLSYCREA
ncbi:LysR family transcriptional regulator [Brenneria goodwinii]|uniref:LysR family transcriptional regulator n=1 Tax=Brenneria goodwinii TaxID=1109412 RepID=A0AAE8JPS6_9GAMM|nr:DNA-binding transcriptional regulator YeiE [Brenneria goodwinii]ATA24342.1 transcriptional regulator [Brenneria goodwinii]RLM29516.1 LysR family transcriptional regulator [Brenneria goodwinii]